MPAIGPQPLTPDQIAELAPVRRLLVHAGRLVQALLQGADASSSRGSPSSAGSSTPARCPQDNQRAEAGASSGWVVASELRLFRDSFFVGLRDRRRHRRSGGAIPASTSTTAGASFSSRTATTPSTTSTSRPTTTSTRSSSATSSGPSPTPSTSSRRRPTGSTSGGRAPSASTAAPSTAWPRSRSRRPGNALLYGLETDVERRLPQHRRRLLRRRHLGRLLAARRARPPAGHLGPGRRQRQRRPDPPDYHGREVLAPASGSLRSRSARTSLRLRSVLAPRRRQACPGPPPAPIAPVCSRTVLAFVTCGIHRRPSPHARHPHVAFPARGLP